MQDLKEITILFKALSEEIRVRILALLLDGELCVCDLIAVLKLPQSTVSRHLAYLKKAGMVEANRREPWAYYRLPTDRFGLHGDLLQMLTDHLGILAVIRQDRRNLQAYLATKKSTACAEACSSVSAYPASS